MQETQSRFDEEWEPLLPLFSDKPEDAQLLIHRLFLLKQHLQSPEGVLAAKQLLDAGIRLIYPYTPAYKAALEHYLLSLEGQMKPQDEPIRLLRGAIERAKGATHE